MIGFLLLLYPARWRKEYGPEFSGLLASQPLTPRIIINVAGGATLQRLRYTPLWLLIGLALLSEKILDMVLQFFRHPIPEIPYSGYVCILAAAIWIAGRKDGRFLSGLFGAIGANLMRDAPMLILAAIPTSKFTDGDGSPLTFHSPLEAVAYIGAIAIGTGAVIGLSGALVGSGIRVLRRRMMS